MSPSWKRRAGWGGAILALAGLVWFLFRPEPVAVETGSVDRGRLRVAVEAEGRTRARDREVVSAPVTGRCTPVDLDEGDSVSVGTVVARLRPVPLDPRSRVEAEARLSAALEARKEAEARAGQAGEALEEARRDLQRMEKLADSGSISRERLEQARTAARTAELELEAAEFRARAAEFEVQRARAALQAADPERGDGTTAVSITSPVRGQVLRTFEECERVLAAGEPIIEVGDPSSLEVVVDVLSTDAVSIRRGDLMLVHGWGGGDTLVARVRTVEPSAFTEVSPLGIQEQRVNVVGDLPDPPERLGDRYRVEVSVVTWEGEDVLRVPSGALFRGGGGWAVFVVEGKRVRLRPVEIGHRNPFHAQVAAGLEAGETVILHPDDRLEEGTRVAPR